MDQTESNVWKTTNLGPQIFGSDRGDYFTDATQLPLRGILFNH